MKKARIQLEDLTCPSCIQKIEGAVSTLKGIDQDTLKVGFNSSTVKFDFDQDKIDIKEVEKEIERIGYEVKNSRVK